MHPAGRVTLCRLRNAGLGCGGTGPPLSALKTAGHLSLISRVQGVTRAGCAFPSVGWSSGQIVVGLPGLSQGQGPGDPGAGLRLCGAKPFGGQREPLSSLEPRGSCAMTQGKRRRRSRGHVLTVITMCTVTQSLRPSGVAAGRNGCYGIHWHECQMTLACISREPACAKWRMCIIPWILTITAFYQRGN